MRAMHYSLTAFILLLIFSCSKSDNKKDQILKITPESVVSCAGKDWPSISSGFSSKKGYSYTTLNSGNILAAMSLPAEDDGAPAHNFKLLFNINQENRVTSLSLQSTDSLSVTTDNQLFLYYYDRAFSIVPDVTYTFAMDNYDQQVRMEVQDLISELKGLNCAQASLTYKNNVMNLTAGFYKGTFTISIFAP